MFWTGIIPALLVLWIRLGVSESPVWLERQRHLRETGGGIVLSDRISIVRLIQADLLWTLVQASILMSAFMIS